MLDSKYKASISIFLEQFFLKEQLELASDSYWADDVSLKLGSFVSQGKMIRGSLVLYIVETYTGMLTERAVRIAAALELIHSSFLIHDDIMDNDSKRRGEDTLHTKYQLFGEKKQLINSKHFGESMAICLSDIGFFLGFKLLSEEENEQSNTIIRMCMDEFIKVGLAQMQDVYAGSSNESFSQEEIERVYRFKTGRYTFSLPMMIGAVLAGKDIKTVETLEKLGEVIGLLFQLTDDTLSIFGEETVTGKPIGSDIRENKKTLYRLHLFNEASDSQKQRLESIFGKAELTNEDIRYVQDLLRSLGILKKTTLKMKQLQNTAIDILYALDMAKTNKIMLENLIKSIIERKK